MKSLPLTVCVLPVLFLAACDGEWEMKLVTDVFPYGNERTAGSGVAYVLAKMAPAMGANLETETVEVKRVTGPSIVEKQAEDKARLERMFENAQRK